ncbi:acyl-CoA dehydrogenase family protein [Mycobacteroides abscessus]|uniref:acyl-CoA dehydrogenase family protein n=1 Tax=Mycobacteroides abscessus TaxID=36809 RepID=UPI00373FCCC8
MKPTLAGELIGSLAITEPGGGSDVGHLTTSAKRDGDRYIVNGAKTFITSGVEQLSIPVDRGVSGDLRFGVLIAV